MKEQEIISKVKQSIVPHQSEVSKRNEYMRERDEYIYGDALISKIDLTDAMDVTRYNWLSRTVEIHTSGIMGRLFQVTSTYDKRDLSIAKDLGDEQQLKEDYLMNKKLKGNADARRNLVHAMIRDNGDDELFLNGAEKASAYGFTVYKSWPDVENKMWKFENLENPENFYALWSGKDYNARDADVYMTQISELSAYQQYGDYITEDEKFAVTPQGAPLGAGDGEIITEQDGSDTKMVTVIEYTGFLSGIGGSKALNKRQKDSYDGTDEDKNSRYPDTEDYLVEVDPGKETPVNLLIVGDIMVRCLTDEDKLPKYWIIQNKKRPKRPWGVSDISQEAIDINITFLERMSNWNTVIDRVGFPKYKGRGFSGTNLPRPKPRVVEVLPMGEAQDIDLLGTPDYSIDFNRITEALKEEFVRAVAISRVLFDDPDVAANSNQALTTTMKGMTDTVEKKQKLWQKALREMFEDALMRSGKLWKEVEEVLDEDDDWHLSIRWPSILRKDDSVYQQNLINRFNTGTMSLDTFLEEGGSENVSEELDRIRDNFQDPVAAAILSRQTALLAQQIIMPPMPPEEPKPDVKVSLRGNLTPNQEANIAAQNGFLEGPYPPSAGPQGNEGDAANTNVINTGYIEGDQNKAGFGEQIAPDGSPAGTTPAPAQPQTTPDGNQDGTGIMSQPGSGQAQPVSPQGAGAMTNQNNGA